jgi:hypothetical protein
VGKRDSGYERVPKDRYETPHECTLALGPHIPDRIRTILEPASGTGKMVRALEGLGYEVEASDIETGHDFPQLTHCDADAIITNPPYGERNRLAVQFIEHALDLTKPHDGFVAMFLPTDFDHAISRRHLFGKCSIYAKRVVLTWRPLFFDGPGSSRAKRTSAGSFGTISIAGRPAHITRTSPR